MEIPYVSMFSQSESKTHLCHVRIPGSHVLLNKRLLTSNHSESTRLETGRKTLLLQHP